MYIRALPSVLSLSRLVVAFLLVSTTLCSPLFCLVWAVFSDVMDGALARWLRAETAFGRYIDPIADKCFALSFVYYLHRMSPFSLSEIGILFSRDMSLVAFWLMLLLTGKLHTWRVRAFFLGKVMTTLQFLLFFLKIEGLPIAPWLWYVLLFVGVGSFFELVWRLYTLRQKNLGEKI